jgi:hypothetical protein
LCTVQKTRLGVFTRGKRTSPWRASGYSKRRVWKERTVLGYGERLVQSSLPGGMGGSRSCHGLLRGGLTYGRERKVCSQPLEGYQFVQTKLAGNYALRDHRYEANVPPSEPASCTRQDDSRSTPRSSKVFVCPRVRRSLGTAVPPLPLLSCMGAFLRSPSREAAVEEPVITHERPSGRYGR